MIGKLEYCCGGQIRDAKTKQLVSPREIVKAWNESQAVNAAAIREALVKIVELAKEWGDHDYDPAITLGLIIDRADDALATPPRNFDVGTAEDQSYRFAHYCGATGCGNCSLGTVKGDCEFAWAQTPYDAEKGGKA